MSDTQPIDDLNMAQPAAGPSSRSRMLAIGLVALLAIVGITFLLLNALGGGSEAQVTLRSLGSAGDDPFTSAVAPRPTASLSDFAQNGPPPDTAVSNGAAGSATLAKYRTISGSVPGVFGGSLNEETCDTDQLVRFLTSEPEKAQAWARVLGMDVTDIAAYVDSLTGVNLGADTRVLDHGYTNGKLVVRQAVLQRGTAALVDTRGVPRVDCYSGNPLRQPTVEADETFVGTAWPAFDESEIVVINDGAQDLEAFELFDVADGTRFTRPTGSTGGSDLSAATTAPAVADAAVTPTPVPAPTTPPPVTRELTLAGDIAVNTRVKGEVGSMQDELIYAFDAPDGAKLLLEVLNDRASVGSVGVDLRSGGERITFMRVPAGGSEAFPFTLSHEAGGRYEVIISEGPSLFDFIVQASAQDDAGAGRDAGDNFTTALEISGGQLIAGHLAGLDQDDTFLVDLVDAPMLVLSASAERGSQRSPAFELQVRGESLDFFRVNPADEQTIELLFGNDDDVLELYVTEGPAEYTFTAELIPQQDGAQAGDAPSDLPNARVLESIDSFSGQVGDRDQADYFLFDAPADEFSVTIDVASTSVRALGVDVLGPDGVRIDFFRVQPGATGSIDIEGIQGETYRLLLTEGRATYQVSIS